MSFAADVKQEICAIPAKTHAQAGAELSAALGAVGGITLTRGKMALRLTLEHRGAARRIVSILNDFFKVQCAVAMIDSHMSKAFRIDITGGEDSARLLAQLGYGDSNGLPDLSAPPAQTCKTKAIKHAFVRGLYLCCGTVTHPQKNYQAEFCVKSEAFAAAVADFLQKMNLPAKIMLRKSDYVVYLKGGDNIAALLAVLGAGRALLLLEDVRVIKDMRNNVNRAVNCETANIGKTVAAAQRQMAAIRKIQAADGFSALSRPLRETAELRLSYPGESLEELALLAGTTKSAINHRLRKLMDIAQSL